jgi:hypothetical protein
VPPCVGDIPSPPLSPSPLKKAPRSFREKSPYSLYIVDVGNIVDSHGGQAHSYASIGNSESNILETNEAGRKGSFSVWNVLDKRGSVVEGRFNDHLACNVVACDADTTASRHVDEALAIGREARKVELDEIEVPRAGSPSEVATALGDTWPEVKLFSSSKAAELGKEGEMAPERALCAARLN